MFVQVLCAIFVVCVCRRGEGSVCLDASVHLCVSVYVCVWTLLTHHKQISYGITYPLLYTQCGQHVDLC